MNRVHLVLLWHMHQPQYRDPATGRYLLPWTRLHALKDYWGMVKILEEFPRVHVTFNLVPALVAQLEEYASGKFDEPWFELAFRRVEDLGAEDKAELLARAFQVNRENLMVRWPRYVELFEWVQHSGDEEAAATFGPRDWRDLQTLSQLAWMDPEWLAGDAEGSRLSRKGADFSEQDKEGLRAKQLELLSSVLREYRRAAARGQIEISTTPYYHPILPLLCDTDVARAANPAALLLEPAFRHPEDAREQLRRAQEYHQRVFGQPPAGLWPSEGGVSDQALALAAEAGFRWFATDEGVLGRTLGVGFGRDAAGVPANADRLYAPLGVRLGGREIAGFFRDHYLSDLIGFVYSRIGAAEAAEDLHRRIRTLGERVQFGQPPTVAIILDGENAWEHFPGGGRDFLREFYRRLDSDSEIRALTASEALAEAGESSVVERIAPGSWINANFDIWIGHSEDLTAWNLLRAARAFYAQAQQNRARGIADAPTEQQLAAAYESVLAAEGSDWCWWYGPEHSTANDAEFDALYRKHLTEIYLALGAVAPDELAEPIKRKPEPALVVPPTDHLRVVVDGRETSYFEWLGAGLYSAGRRGSAMHARSYYLHELRYGFSEQFFYVRVDVFPEAPAWLGRFEFRVIVRAKDEIRVVAQIEGGKLAGYHLECNDLCILAPQEKLGVAFDKILEVAIARELLTPGPRNSLALDVALWHGGLPVDVLPAEGWLEVNLGAEAFGWPGA
jgi:alpha-amylase/alpha-mannosidase (GH57 family)